MAEMMATWREAPTFLKPGNHPQITSACTAEMAKQVDEFELKLQGFISHRIFGLAASIPFRI
jgi:hypothetical protein